MDAAFASGARRISRDLDKSITSFYPGRLTTPLLNAIRVCVASVSAEI